MTYLSNKIDFCFDKICGPQKKANNSRPGRLPSLPRIIRRTWVDLIHEKITGKFSDFYNYENIGYAGSKNKRDPGFH